MTISRRVEVGSLLAGYRVVGLAGRGGTGEVYRAHGERLNRGIALKVLSARYAADASFRDRLVRESQLAASLDQRPASIDIGDGHQRQRRPDRVGGPELRHR